MRKFKTGGVSQCAYCQKQLVRIKNGFKFDLIQDPLGNQTRVHKMCAQFMIGDGYKHIKNKE